jgi:hypothetical protein
LDVSSAPNFSNKHLFSDLRSSILHSTSYNLLELPVSNLSVNDLFSSVSMLTYVTKLKEFECKVAVLEEENRFLSEETKGNSNSTIQELECKIEILEDENETLLEKLENFDLMKFQELECRIEVLVEENNFS